MDRLEAMSLFLHAVEAGSLSKASRQLGLPLATVSRKVAELESHLGATLLTRSSRGLSPTPAGCSYVAAAKAILEQLTEAERAVAGEYTAPRRDLAITAPVMFGRLHVLPVVTEFLRAYPDICVGLVLTDRLAHLVDDQVDVALRIGDLPDSGLTANRLGSVRRVVCGSPAYLAARGTPFDPAELAQHCTILSAGASPLDTWRFASGETEVVSSLRSRLSVNTVEAAIDAAQDGLGLIRAFSYQVADHVRHGRLTIILARFEPTPPPVHMVFNGNSRLPLKLRAFIDFAGPRLRERLKEAAFGEAVQACREPPA